MKSLPILFLVLALIVGTGTVFAQQGGNGADMQLNTAINGGPLDFFDKTCANGDFLLIQTLSPGGSLNNFPVILAGDLVPTGLSICVPLPSGPCNFNLGINTFLIVDGTGLLGPLAAWATMAPIYGFQVGLQIPVDGSLFCPSDDAAIRLQAGTLDPSNIDGFAITNFVDNTVASISQTLPAGDDSFHLVDLCGQSFTFYGVPWTQVYVNSNGSLTFGAGDTDFTASAGEMTAQEPRIAPMWSDWSPNIAGSVVTTFGRDLSSSQLDTLNVQWTDVPRFSQGATQNTFGTLLYLDSHAFFPGDIDMFSTQFQGTDTGNLMGISPGGGAAGASQSLNVPSIVGASNEALFWFGGTADCTNPTDMAGSYGWFTPTGADTYDWILALAPPAPVTASGIVPDSGPDTGGTSVTITGKNFNALSPLGVEFGLGNPATNVVLVDPCTITCDTPAGPAGPVDVIVTDGSTSATLSGGYTYVPAGSFSGTFTLGDDGSANYVFNNGSFTFYGVLRTDIWVNANGNLTFNSADSDFSESPLEMLSDQPRIAIFWDDIHPGVGGSVGFLEDLNGVNFSYDNVPAYTTGDNTGSATLTYASGNIGLAWGTCTSFNGTVSARNCIAGISPGGSLGAQLAVDFGSTGTTSGASNEALFMWYNDGTGIPWNIDGKSATLAPTGLDSYDAIMP